MATKVPVIVKGADKALAIRLVSETSQDPFDFSGASEIVAHFINADGTCQDYALSLGGITILSAQAGRFQVNLPASGTDLLAVTDAQAEQPYPGVEVVLTLSGKKTIVNLPGSIDVQNRLFTNC